MDKRSTKVEIMDDAQPTIFDADRDLLAHNRFRAKSFAG
jgi:hypothetical protein